MGNFEKLSVLVIGVIIVMILVVALYTWTDDPADEQATVGGQPASGLIATHPTDPTPATPASSSTPSSWVDAFPPAPAAPKEVEVVTQRPDEPGSKIENAVTEVAVKTPAEEPVEQAEERTYTVKGGDTLGGIALETLGSTKYWKLIAERNNVDPMKIRIGMTLIIPSVDGAGVAPNKTVADVSSGGPAKPGATYTIRKGDTIQKISQSAYKTIERWTDIWFANMERISDPRDLRPGMTIDIPN